MKTEKFISPKTTELFWDCECKSDYIFENSIEKCGRCGAHQEDQPDSHIEEVLQLFIGKEITVTHDYFNEGESLIMIPNRYEMNSEEADGEDVLWDDKLSQWCTLEYAVKYLVQK